MRIVYVADAPRLGGAERYLIDVIAGARAAGQDVTLISPQQAVLDYARSHVTGLATVQAGNDEYARAPGMAVRLRALLGSGAQLARAIRRTRADLVHINNGGYPGSDLCRLAPILARRRPALMSVHSIPWAREHSDPRLQAAVDRALWPSLDAVAAATRIVGSTLVEQRGLPPAKFRLLPYGVPEPPDNHEAAALRARLCPGGELLIGMVAATADPGKGHRVLLDAMHLMREPARAVIVGADPGADFAAEARITLAGRVDSVGPYLRAIDVLVVPSTQWESLPLVILEAMAARKAVFGSRLAGIPEAIADGETGRLVPPGDAAALAAALDEAARDRLGLARLGEAGRVRWEKSHSPERMIDAALELYRTLART